MKALRAPRWLRAALHPWTLSIAAHAVLAAALWSGAGRLGVRGPSASPAADDVRDEGLAVTWELAEQNPPAEPATREFPEPDDQPFVAPSEAPVANDPSTPLDAPPDEVDVPPDETPVAARAPEPDVAFAPGRPIPLLRPRHVIDAVPSPAAPLPTATRPTAASPASPPPPPHRPLVAVRGGGDGAGVRPPVLAPGGREPVRPADALARGERGRVRLLIHISAEGLVTDVTIAQSSGSVALDRAALDAARTWRFRPAARDDGTPIASNVRMGVNFD